MGDRGRRATSAAGGESVIFTVGEGPTLALTIVATDADRGSKSATYYLEVLPQPEILIGAPEVVTAERAGLVATAPELVGASYAWTIEGGEILEGEASRFEWTIEGGTITEGAGTDTVTFTAGEGTSLELGVAVTNAAGERAAYGREIAIVAAPVGASRRRRAP